ncbi:hypothetical protein [Dyella humicola]|uniref:hypothetical protein n=1 Tax=Dyella humicola TaxID=2992126 RepID=UPI002258BD16|nr:hypothetical protein [Dyella humicola]
MANLSVLVSLDTTKTPPVTTNPEELDVQPGSNVITWSVDPASPIQNFNFSSLHFNPPTPPCFTNMGISNPQITIQDNNTTPVPAPYGYTLGVTYNGRIYNSGSAAAGAATPRAEGRGSPSIHNN